MLYSLGIQILFHWMVQSALDKCTLQCKERAENAGEKNFQVMVDNMSNCDLFSNAFFKIVSFKRQILTCQFSFFSISLFSFFVHTLHPRSLYFQAFVLFLYVSSLKVTTSSNINHRALWIFYNMFTPGRSSFFPFSFLPSHIGIVLFHSPGCWLPGATHVTVDQPFKR